MYERASDESAMPNAEVASSERKDGRGRKTFVPAVCWSLEARHVKSELAVESAIGHAAGWLAVTKFSIGRCQWLRHSSKMGRSGKLFEQ
jgi:hypothetical protein